MINRTYFISAIVYAEDATEIISKSHRCETITSLFAKDATDVCRYMVDEIANDLYTASDRVHVTQFRRVD